MNQQKNQGDKTGGLLDNIQKEVRPENAPLLEFITRHASAMAGIVLVLLLALGGMAIWNWYHGAKQDEARQELARINADLKGAEKETALNKLAENAPKNTKFFIYMSLAQSAQENGNPVLAADAYAKASKLDGDGALGLTAALGGAGSLLMQGQYAEALALLRELESRIPEVRGSVELRQMLAEAAARAGNPQLALETYQSLADELKTPEAAYFRSRAKTISQELAARKDNESQNPEPQTKTP